MNLCDTERFAVLVLQAERSHVGRSCVLFNIGAARAG